tara:strand:+ start:110 stop:331 length:222 start_codon:yes stop_codon:yes gene_type:complete
MNINRTINILIFSVVGITIYLVMKARKEMEIKKIIETTIAPAPVKKPCVCPKILKFDNEGNQIPCDCSHKKAY